MSGIYHLGQKDIAELLGVTTRSIRDWHKEGLPRNADGTYPGPACVAWAVGRAAPSAGDYDNQRERLAAAQAEKVEMENAVRRGQLADVSVVASTWTDLISNARAKLLNMGPKLGPQLVNIGDPNVIATAIRTEVYVALTELADYDPAGSGPEATGPVGQQDVVAPTESDGKPVGRPRKAVKQRGKRRAGRVAD